VVAGIASALAGIFSMGMGEYLSSKSQVEIFRAHIARERVEVGERPGEAEAEVAYMLTEEGMSAENAAQVAGAMARHPEVLLKTMVSRELGLIVEDEAGSPLQGAFLMAASFGVASVVPILPFLFLAVSRAMPVAIVATALVLFGIGAVKSRWTHRSFLVSGLEIVALAAFAGVAGYFFGTLLPDLLSGITG
jgi:VIT1/CCC1 family predicted Fe2+/Mn2+ transporter